MKDALIVSLLSIAPRRTGARGMGWIARRRASRLMARWFVRAYAVDMEEAAGDLADYPTLEALFSRPLKVGARPVDDRPHVLVSPVDGRVAAVGRTRNGRIAVAPRREIDVAALLGDQLTEERDVAVLYLSPRDYHRVHVPREGVAVAWKYVPGTLWPVFPAAVRRVRGLFTRNERAVVRMETDHGPLDIALVGAFGVGRITLSLCDLVTNSRRHPTYREARLEPHRPLERGQELGIFHLGSTVVLAAPPGRWRWTIQHGDPVRVGRAIGVATAALPGPIEGKAQ
ncbi:MAG: phosphatidylserine decarboxylase [Deltaproteobacteria bacterium]|nr:phosphatidylserine decarboxylase [Deltaproteobacteria bacterium]